MYLFSGIGAIIGIVSGACLVFIGGSSFTMGAAIAGVLCIIPLTFIVPPSVIYSCFLACILLFEEFPSGLGETVERSTRTAFYSRSLGIPGLYAPDLLLIGALCLYFLYAFLHKKKIAARIDMIGIALIAVFGSIGIAAGSSLLFGDPLKPVTVVESSGVGFSVNERGLTYIALFQFKNFCFLLLSYYAGLFFFETEKQLGTLKKLFLLFGFGNIVIGLARLSQHPDLIKAQIPLFYHSPTSWLFALVIFYAVLAWATGQIKGKSLFPLAILSFFAVAFIILSFRRTIWFAIAAASIILLVYIPTKARTRLLIAGTLGASIVLVLLLFSPFGHLIMDSVLNRISQTNEKDLSTLYRLSLFVYFGKHFSDIPLLGYGLTPLWNIPATLGYFRTNIENIHSLYFWIVLRTGYIGVICFFTAFVLIMIKMTRFVQNSVNREYKNLVFIMILACAMYVISGFFNPVYAEIRYLVLLGTGLAMVSRMHEWERIGHDR